MAQHDSADPFSQIARLSAPVRRSFVERPDAAGQSPLASLLSGVAAPNGGGGRGGRLRVAVLLTLVWVIAKEPYTSIRIARYWAELLGLREPEDAGARAVRDTLHDLEERGFVRLRGTASGNLEIALLSEAGDHKPYSLPDPAEGESYFRVPRSFWAEGWIAQMSGRALAMYLVALSNSGWGNREFWISTELFRNRYGLSETTRKRGLSELVKLGVLDVSVESRTRGGIVGGRTFRRNVYSFRTGFQSPETASARSETDDDTSS